jgi:type II secretory pathway pseudopilin PulG
MPRRVRTTRSIGGRRAARGARAVGRAFTLIEILIAIGLLVAVLSIAGPALFARIAPRTFDATLERFEGELRLAREDARRTGEIALVYATRSADGRTLRIESRRTPIDDGFTVAGPAEFGGAFAGAAGGGADGWGGAGFPRDEAGDAGVFGNGGGGLGGLDDERPRLLFTLPEGYTLEHTRPAFLIEDDGFGATLSEAALDEIGGIDPGFDPEMGEGFGAMGPDPFGEIDAEPASVLLAVCVPDGTVLSARPTWVVDPDERVARLRIDPASGIIRLERVERRADESDSFMDDFSMPEGAPSGVRGGGEGRP